MTAPAKDDSLLEKARAMTNNGTRVPPKSALQKSLRVGWEKAVEVHDRLSTEVELAGRVRAVQRRANAKRMGVQKTPSRQLPPRLRPLPAPPVSPAVQGFLAAALPQVTLQPGELVAPPVGVFHGPFLPAPAATAPVIADPVAGTVAEEPIASTQEEPPQSSGRVVTWPALLVAAPAFVAIWAGWVAIGKLTGFGKVNLLPGFGGGLVVDTAITLPIGVEVYSAFAFYVFLHTAAPRRARVFAAWSAGLAVVLGMGAQTAYHLLSAAGVTAAPWQITTFVSCLPVAVFAVTAVLVHMVRQGAGSQVKGDR